LTAVIQHLQALHEAIDLTFRIHDALFARVERMAIGANIGADFLDGCACCPCVATCTCHDRVGEPYWMNIFFHCRLLSEV